MLYIIVMEIENPGNLGAIARSMKNFGLKNLVLVNPKCKVDNIEAISRSKHAKDLLKKAKVVGLEFLDKMDYLVATTAVMGSDYNLPRSPITPDELAKRVAVKNKVGLLIGREGPGLTNDEIKKCDYCVTIPANPKYPTLNISHACTVLFYELFKAQQNVKSSDHIIACTKKYREVIMGKLDLMLDKFQFAREDMKETQRMVWKKILGKSLLTKREAFALLGLLKRINKGLDKNK